MYKEYESIMKHSIKNQLGQIENRSNQPFRPLADQNQSKNPVEPPPSHEILVKPVLTGQLRMKLVS